MEFQQTFLRDVTCSGPVINYGDVTAVVRVPSLALAFMELYYFSLGSFIYEICQYIVTYRKRGKVNPCKRTRNSKKAFFTSIF